MKEKGISFTAGFVVVVLVVLAGVGYFFLARGPKEGLPVYLGATPSEVPELWSELFATFESHGISASVYTTGASSGEVLDWYRSEMSERGWSKIFDNTFDNSHILSFQKRNEGASVIENEGTLILVHGTLEQFQAVAEEWYQMWSATPYPAVSVVAVNVDNEIRINVTTGVIASGDWQYSVRSTSGSYSWTDGTEALDVPYVSLGTYATGTWYVSLKHKASGHIYFANRLLHILEKEQPANEFTSISELMENPENFDNKTVRIAGTTTSIFTSFKIEDNTGTIFFTYGKGLLYNRGEDVVISVIVRYNLMSSIWPFLVENIEKAEVQPLDLVEISNLLENTSKYNGKIVTVKGTITFINTSFRISDNTGTILCQGWGEVFSHTKGENMIVEGDFHGYRYLKYPENIWTTFMTLQIQKIKIVE